MAIAGFSNFLENKVLDHVFGGTTYTQPATIYVSLHTADPDEDGSGAEVSGGSYARQVATMAAAASGAKATNADLVYTNMPAATVTHVGLWDAVSAGNFLGGGALATPKTTGAGDTFQITSGNLTISLN